MDKMQIIRENLSDMLAVEKHALQRIERQTLDDRVKKFTNAYGMLQKIEGVLNSHINELERYLSTVNGGIEARLKRTATSIAGSFVGVYEKLRTNEPVSRNLRDDYSLINLSVINYGMLHTMALALNETEIATMAKEHMTNLTPLIVELSELIPFVLAEELAGAGKLEHLGVAQEAVTQYRKAWNRDVTMRV